MGIPDVAKLSWNVCLKKFRFTSIKLLNIRHIIITQLEKSIKIKLKQVGEIGHSGNVSRIVN
jgi:hypothetical protein